MAAEADFTDFVHAGEPSAGQACEVLCESDGEKFVAAFVCQWKGGVWTNMHTGREVNARVVGWRRMN